MSDERTYRPSGDQIELASGDQRVILTEVGGGIREYTVGARQVLDGYAAEEMCSSARGQMLMPWPNRLRDGKYQYGGETLQVALSEPSKHNAIHGLVRWVPWRLTDRDRNRAVLRHTLYAQPGYPYIVALQLEYVLDDAGLTVRTTASNLGPRACPFGAGAHPYLSVGTPTIDTALVKIPGRTWLPTDERQIPTGRRDVAGGELDFRAPRTLGPVAIDFAFTDLERDADGRARVELRAEDGTRAAVWMDEAYTYVEIFTGDTLPDVARRRRGLGVEPMTCAPNAFQSGDGLRTLAPGESFTAAWGIEP